MGGSQSRATAELTSNTVIINQTDIDFLNKTVNNLTVNMMIDDAKACGASILQQQGQDIGTIVAGGKSKITLGQDQKAKMSFTCLQESNVQLDIINKIADTMKAQIANANNAEIVNKMAANLQAKSQDQWGSFPWGGASSDTNIKEQVNTFVHNNTKINIQNVVENSTFANFKMKISAECIGKIIQSQNQKIGTIVAGEQGVIELTQSQAADMVMQCVQKANLAQSVITEVVKFTGLDLQVRDDTKTATGMEAESEATSVKQGLFQGVGDLFAAIPNSIFAGIKSIMGAYAPIAAVLLILSLCICCFLIIVTIFGGSIKSFLGSGSSETSATTASPAAPGATALMEASPTATVTATSPATGLTTPTK